ncbi:hypothetical protein B0T25DRAFT_257361 [Lasiosphaeria hispida]|uniref:Uncharacterized protein n=1 Tax=Lasiosphaeria hispida TaxID=260671 RepID=A0AAJ0MCX4_9PEZI|nr:hypothetical protein B0T25DRAFT_257361 [Lasiosphaeria hispida]
MNAVWHPRVSIPLSLPHCAVAIRLLRARCHGGLETKQGTTRQGYLREKRCHIRVAIFPASDSIGRSLKPTKTSCLELSGQFCLGAVVWRRQRPDVVDSQALAPPSTPRTPFPETTPRTAY